jgi:hypothetical protein
MTTEIRNERRVVHRETNALDVPPPKCVNDGG